MSKFDKISGMLVYVQVNEPVKAYNKPGTPVKPDEYKASLVLTDEDYVDELQDYAKELDTLLSLKKVKTVEFEEKYKVAPPEGAGKNVWVLTFKKSSEQGKTGKPLLEQHKPKVFEKIKTKQGTTLVDITHSKLVANGSMGTISVQKFDRNVGGSSLYLQNVLVTNLIEYVKPENNYESGSEFDDEASDGDGGTVKVPASAKAPAAKEKVVKKPKQEDTPQDDDDSDSPF